MVRSREILVPPPYSVATFLPTYDEVEKAKAAAMAASALEMLPWVGPCITHTYTLGTSHLLDMPLCASLHVFVYVLSHFMFANTCSLTRDMSGRARNRTETCDIWRDYCPLSLLTLTHALSTL